MSQVPWEKRDHQAAPAEPDSPLAHALAYAERGWPVFPLHTMRDGSCSCGEACDSPGKHPVASLAPHGLLDASTNPARVTAWWATFPEANVGLLTGPESGLLAIDIDPRNGGDESFDALLGELGPLDDTAEALTGGGGRHLLFEWPADALKLRGKLAPGVDAKGAGGYIVAAPSLHASGRQYEWEASSSPLDGVAVARLPAAWLKRLEPVGASIPPPPHQRVDLSSDKLREVRSALTAISADDYTQWLEVGMALHATGDAQAFDLWDEWSQTSEKYRPGACARKWASFSGVRGGVTLRSVFKAAHDTGWAWRPTPEPASSSAQETETGALRWYPASEWVASMTAPAWIIPEYLEAGSLNVTIGGWGSGKSALELDRACRAVHGLEWQGMGIDPCLWVYVVGEAQRGFQRRVAAWHRHYRQEPSNRLVIIPEAVLVGEKEHEEALARTLAEIQNHYGHPVKVVTLDTMARCFGLDDESSNSDVSRWVGSVQRHIIDVTGAAVSVLHHPGHSNKDRGRGASALPGAADTEWLVERTGSIVTLRCTKSKDSEHPSVKAWRLTGVGMTVDGCSFAAPVVEEADPPEAAAPPRKGSKQEQALAVLVAMYDEARANLADQGRPEFEARIDRPAWRERCDKDGLLSGKNARQQFNSLVQRLQESGLVMVDDPWIYPSVPS